MNTQEPKPLYKVLNESRSIGIWSLAPYQTKTGLHIQTDTFRRNNSQKYICEVKQVLADGGIDNEDENNLKYIAMAVNNFASVCEALDKFTVLDEKHEYFKCFAGLIINARETLKKIK